MIVFRVQEQQGINYPLLDQQGLPLQSPGTQTVIKNMDSIHTVKESEINFISDHINDTLKNDHSVKHKLPITPSNIVLQMQDGLILCKLINQACPKTIPNQALNVGSSLNIFQKTENLNLAIDSAKSIGCTVVNVHAGSILQGKHHIIMGVLWQITKVNLLKGVNLKVVPEIMALLRPDQTCETHLKPEEILLRWLNYHLDLDENLREIKNLGKDLMDGQGYGHVLAHVSPAFDKTYWQLNKQGRAMAIIRACQLMKFKPYATKEDVLSGDSWINMLFCCQLFNKCHGLKLKGEIKLLTEQAQTDQTKQIKVYKNWINSMNLTDVFVEYLIDDLKDGRVLLKVIENIRPNSVDWKQVSNKTDSRIMVIQNCNYAISLCKNQLKMNLINIGGLDLVDGRVTLVLALLSQLCKFYWFNRVGNISDEQLIKWANDRVPLDYQVKSFRDTSISNCMFLLKLVQSIEPRVVNYDCLRKGDSEDDKMTNIKYAISAARRMGAEVMLLSDHILDPNPKFISIMVAELCYRARKLRK